MYACLLTICFDRLWDGGLIGQVIQRRLANVGDRRQTAAELVRDAMQIVNAQPMFVDLGQKRLGSASAAGSIRGRRSSGGPMVQRLGERVAAGRERLRAERLVRPVRRSAKFAHFTIRVERVHV